MRTGLHGARGHSEGCGDLGHRAAPVVALQQHGPMVCGEVGERLGDKVIVSFVDPSKDGTYRMLSDPNKKQ